MPSRARTRTTAAAPSRAKKSTAGRGRKQAVLVVEEESVEDMSFSGSDKSFTSDQENVKPPNQQSLVAAKRTKQQATNGPAEDEIEIKRQPKRGRPKKTEVGAKTNARPSKTPSVPENDREKKRKHRVEADEEEMSAEEEEKEYEEEQKRPTKRLHSDTKGSDTKKTSPTNQRVQVPKTPPLSEAKKAKDLCMSVKRHLERPIAVDESMCGLLEQTHVVPQTPRISKMRSGKEVVAKSDYDELLDRFSELKALRTTKAEKMYTKLQTTTEAREKTTAKFISALKEENKRLKEENQRTLQDKDSQKAKREENQQNQAALQELQQAKPQLQFYQQLTLLEVDPYPDEGTDAFVCMCQNPNDKRALKFILTITEDAVEYKPVEIGKQPKWEINEMFIKEIYFSPQYTPIFLSKLLATIHGNKKTN